MITRPSNNRAFIVMLPLVVAISFAADAQTPTPIQRKASKPYCWNAYVTPDSYTVQCSNGYFTTYLNDGTQVSGNGVIDPNASARGSTIGINPGTGGPTGAVTAPGNMPMEAPHQAPMWGNYPLQTR